MKRKTEDRSFVNRVVEGQSAIRHGSRPSKKCGVISWKLHPREWGDTGGGGGGDRSVIYFPLVLADRLEDLNDHLSAICSDVIAFELIGIKTGVGGGVRLIVRERKEG